MIRRPPRSSLCPYPTLFRSARGCPRSSASAAALTSSWRFSSRSCASGDFSARSISRYPEMLRAEKSPEAQDRLENLQRSEEHTDEVPSPPHLVCRPLLETKK